ncbi:MAG: glycosyltransferase [Candidatus Dojkabacteria bacterium]|nr:glycosyltransferase [Candidatus Dojkabacteria bacterium]
MVNNKYPKVALVTESLYSMGGANRVLEKFLDMFPNSDIYALFGDRNRVSNKFNKVKIYFSFINKFPFVKKLYRYTHFLWPMAIEQFDFTSYDLVISSSSSVAHGVITPIYCKHICYLHSPMRYAWDLKDLYMKETKFGLLKRAIVKIFLNFNRVWDTCASQRPDVVIANSKFVKDRAEKYWGRNIEHVICPPVDKFNGNIDIKRGNYFVSGAPFEPNKGGDFLMYCASIMKFNLKVIGEGSMRKRLERKYRRYPNIQFLGKVSEKEKWNILSKARGYILTGIEDFGIFPVEAMSCGTPVLGYAKGGVLETVQDGKTGILFKEQSLQSFRRGFREIENKKWDYKYIHRYSEKFTKSDFREKILSILNN